MFITMDEAINHDFIIELDDIKPISCMFCGKELKALYRRNLVYNTLTAFSGHEKCLCEKSQDLYNKKLEEERLQRIEEEEEFQRQEMKRKIDRLFKESKLGERFKTRTFDNFKFTNKNKKTYEAALKYSNDFRDIKDGIGLNFMGSYGSGKTHLAAAIAISLLNKGVPVIFGTLISLLGKIKATYESYSREDESEIIDLYSNVPLLVIDDLGKEKPSEWVLEKLYFIINQRYENYKPVVITTNYSADKLIERLTVKNNIETAEAIVSRLHEICKWVVLIDDDYRTK